MNQLFFSGIDIESLSKEEIYEMVNKWIEDGLLAGKNKFVTDGVNYGNVWNKVKDGTLFLTTYVRIVATDKAVRDMFQDLITAGRVMSIQAVTIRHPEAATYHAIEMMVKKGQLLKVRSIGSTVLYIE